MEIIQPQVPQETENYLNFKGTGASLFEIYLVNILLGMVTLGLYYPWGRARLLKYIYGETSFYGNRLAFHGTGREMFVGFIKALIIIIVFYGFLIYNLLSYQDELENSSGDMELIANAFLTFMIYLYGLLGLFFLTIVPLAIHGALKYRLAKTSWRGIRLGYRGIRSSLFGIYIRDFLLSVITLGIYTSWFKVNLRKYILSNIRFGNVTFSYEGAGSDLFVINLKGIILSFLTLGIYSFWYLKDLYNFYVDNIRVHQNGQTFKVSSSATVGGIFELLVLNWFIVTFTFGLGTPWALSRSLKFYMGNALVEGGFNPDLVTQTEEEYNDALAEDLTDMFDLAII